MVMLSGRAAISAAMVEMLVSWRCSVLVVQIQVKIQISGEPLPWTPMLPIDTESMMYSYVCNSVGIEARWMRHI